MPFEDVGNRADWQAVSQCFNCQSDVIQSDVSSSLWFTAKAPTSQHLALRNMTNIEHRSQFQLLQNLRPRDAEGLGKRRTRGAIAHGGFQTVRPTAKTLIMFCTDFRYIIIIIIILFIYFMLFLQMQGAHSLLQAHCYKLCTETLLQKH